MGAGGLQGYQECSAVDLGMRQDNGSGRTERRGLQPVYLVFLAGMWVSRGCLLEPGAGMQWLNLGRGRDKSGL